MISTYTTNYKEENKLNKCNTVIGIRVNFWESMEFPRNFREFRVKTITNSTFTLHQHSHPHAQCKHIHGNTKHIRKKRLIKLKQIVRELIQK